MILLWHHQNLVFIHSHSLPFLWRQSLSRKFFLTSSKPASHLILGSKKGWVNKLIFWARRVWGVCDSYFSSCYLWRLREKNTREVDRRSKSEREWKWNPFFIATLYIEVVEERENVLKTNNVLKQSQKIKDWNKEKL